MPFIERLLQPRPAAAAPDRSGATLLLTLGILTVISILTVTFLLSARLQKQATVISRNRQAAENALPVALATAMRQIEESLSYPNFTDEEMRSASGASARFQRLAPVGRWFSERYEQTNDINPNISFQFGPVLTSPTVTEGTSINLLTPEALALVPPALTNALPLDARDPRPLRSGWIPSNMLESIFSGSALSSDLRLENKPSRIAFAIFDCSGAIDANVFPGRPTAQKPQRRYFSQADVTRDVISDGDTEGGAAGNMRINDFLLTNSIPLTAETEPFFHTSYDPGPDTYRYHAGGGNDILGNENFNAHAPMDLNNPGFHQALTALTSGNLAYRKFNINSLTNYLYGSGTPGVEQWFQNAEVNLNWVLPVTTINQLCLGTRKREENYAVASPSTLAWTIANFIDPDRIPQKFNLDGSAPATRVSYIVEDVPLINKISIFDIYESDLGPEEKVGNLSYYNADPSLSNHYAVAVELWYPFAPNPPPEDFLDPACYIGIHTNAADVVTSTNRPLSNAEMRAFFDWIFAETSNTVMQVLFERWGRTYQQRVGQLYLSNHPLWQIITHQEDSWFTTNMVNHPFWPQIDTNGNFTIESSPVYQAFYPDTFDIVTTNDLGVVSTNSYTYMTATNYWLTSVSGGITNQFIYGEYYEDSAYTLLFWEDTSGVITSNLLGAVIDDTGEVISMNLSENIPLSIDYDEIEGRQYITYQSALTGEISASEFTALVTAPVGDTLRFRPQRGIFFTMEEFPVEPLYIPEDLQESLDFLFGLLPTNDINELERFLMLTPDEMLAEDWDNLFDWFQSNPTLNRTLLPQVVEPSLGNLSEKDRYSLVPGVAEEETVDFVSAGTQEENFQGYFWTVYPKQTVSFLEIVERTPIGAPEDSDVTEIVTNCYALGAIMPGSSKPNTVWVRPAVTILGYDPGRATVNAEEGGDPIASDIIVDEALLLAKSDAISVQGWTAVTNMYVPEPRDNAFASKWRSFYEPWDSANNSTNLSHGVKEMPFIHYNRPLPAIGDLGHIYTRYTRNTANDNSPADALAQKQFVAIEGAANGGSDEDADDEAPYDTISFAMPSGASLLDFYTVSTDRGPRRGLFQANTTIRPSLDVMLSGIPLGWTNRVSLTSHDPDHRWSQLWCEALTNTQFNTGWRSFADMLPALSTNEMHRHTTVMQAGPHPMYNYTEDVLRGIIDKVSFRQNVFVIILAAQVVAPGTELSRYPNVLSEQRAAVTVIRDAYSGNWTVSDWRKLSQ